MFIGLCAQEGHGGPATARAAARTAAPVVASTLSTDPMEATPRTRRHSRLLPAAHPIMIGLGGAEFRLPLPIGLFGFAALSAVILNKAMSLAVLLVALPARLAAAPPPRCRMLARRGQPVGRRPARCLGRSFLRGCGRVRQPDAPLRLPGDPLARAHGEVEVDGGRVSQGSRDSTSACAVSPVALLPCCPTRRQFSGCSLPSPRARCARSSTASRNRPSAVSNWSSSSISAR